MTKNHAKTTVFTTLDILQLKKKNDDCESIYSVNPLYLRVDHVDGYIEELGGNKYLIFNSTDENKEILKKYTMMFLMELETKSKKWAVMNAIMKKIT